MFADTAVRSDLLVEFPPQTSGSAAGEAVRARRTTRREGGPIVVAIVGDFANTNFNFERVKNRGGGGCCMMIYGKRTRGGMIARRPRTGLRRKGESGGRWHRNISDVYIV